MTERQIRYRLDKKGLSLRKRNNKFMVIDISRFTVISGCDKQGNCTLSLKDVQNSLEINSYRV